MVKNYCDQCGEEITAKNKAVDTIYKADGFRLTGKHKSLEFSVMIGKDGTSNKGDFCKYCIIDAVSSIDDRPQQGCPECKSMDSKDIEHLQFIWSRLNQVHSESEQLDYMIKLNEIIDRLKRW